MYKNITRLHDKVTLKLKTYIKPAQDSYTGYFDSGYFKILPSQISLGEWLEGYLGVFTS